MISINEKKVSDRFKDFEKKINTLDKKAISALKKQKEWYNLDPNQLKWINSIIEFIEREKIGLIDISFEKLKEVVDKFETVKNGDVLVDRQVRKNKARVIRKKFKDVIIDALNYEDLKNKLFKEFFSEIDIKTCVYCNSQYAITIEKTKNDFQARFQFDHIYPQEKYPHLSISILNLVPSCSTCNNVKSSKELEFKPYTDGKTSKDYGFVLDKKSVINYFTTFNKSIIQFNFTDSDYNSQLNDTSLENNFQISKIYNEHKDIAEEIILNSYVYNNIHAQDLKDFIKSKMPNNKIPFERLFIGNYLDNDDLLRRPMAKFTKDIFDEIQILKSDIDKKLKI
ncbi:MULTISPECIES: HNH endonuclease [unclassified Flavobacterium]|uniref:HNH endonuclease n=1 Tax=unclassified Flavobacterium TaxID=196869 RepID=UPI0009697003|nr:MULTISPECIES: HNH endonuclease [unclassified Flavobacterium]MBN9283174.1 HNH endonuclease [Flavobacterium sp.]OJV67800.1 MAG: hypothetical protein BGO42_17410 [Flavobacterium sp. 40-81]